jgi:4-hydroxybenzoyl-CoA thioesterase
VSRRAPARIPIRFGDVDHARIVYYPRFFHYFHVAFEDFFFTHLGRAYVDVLERLRLGFPAVRAEAEFRAPLRFGDVLNMEVSVARLGRTSVAFRYRGRCRRRLAVEGEVTCVCVDMRTFRSRPLPPALRRALRRHHT